MSTSASWEDSIGGITRPFGAARELGVEVERARGPAHLVAVLDERLAALAGHQLGQLVGAGAQPRRDLVQRLGALGRRRGGPLALGAPGRLDRRVELGGVGRPDLGHLLFLERVLHGEGGPVPGHQLAADQQSRLHGGHGGSQAVKPRMSCAVSSGTSSCGLWPTPSSSTQSACGQPVGAEARGGRRPRRAAGPRCPTRSAPDR